MNLPGPIYEGRFLRRYKRFFADIEFDGKLITAHVPNTGSMKTCTKEGALCRFSYHDDPKRKLKYTLQMVKMAKSWVGVNTHFANDLVHEAFLNDRLPHWQKFNGAQREVKISDKSRVDLVLFDDEKFNDQRLTMADFAAHRLHFVEVKNVTLAEDNVAYFPDAVTTRGQKHLEELMHLMDQGHSAELFLPVQRNDAREFRPADHIDPDYGKLLRQAQKKGLVISPFCVKFKKSSIQIDGQKALPIEF